MRANQLGSFTFDWSEVTARVVGLLPIFEEVVDVTSAGNWKGKPKHKTMPSFVIYTYMVDVVFCDLMINSYEFQQGVEIIPQASQNTIRINWNSLLSWVDQQLPQVKIWSDFTALCRDSIGANRNAGSNPISHSLVS